MMNNENRELIALLAELQANGYTRAELFNEALERAESWTEAAAVYLAADRMFGRVFENASA